MDRWTDIVTVEPTKEPVCVADAKHYIRIDHSDDDALFSRLITTARKWVEDYCGRAIMTQTRQLKGDDFPCDVLNLFRVPLASITSVAYTDQNGNSQTVSSAQYQVDTTSIPARLGLVDGYSWPLVKAKTFNAVVITYVAGVSSEASVPAAIKEAILAMVKAMFYGCGVSAAADSNVLTLLAEYRVWWPC